MVASQWGYKEQRGDRMGERLVIAGVVGRLYGLAHGCYED
jgi:hypothetical protein